MKKVLIAGLFLALTNVAMASTEDELTSLSYISYLERYATILPANQDESLEAVINMPLVAGDRVDTAREARMEVVLADGNTVWLDEYTTLSFDAVAFSRDSEAERTVIFLAEGSIIVEVSEFALSSKSTRIDSRGATVYLDGRGLYRLRALPTGGLRLEVLDGLAEAATSAGGVLIRGKTTAEIGGGEVQRTGLQFTWDDDFAAWVEMRRQVAAGESSQHVDLRAAQLDNYGSWMYVDSINAWAWQPSVSGGWQPYRAGRWYWTSTGYAWISYEPWGWLPYHYGSWYHDVGFGWVWSWGRHWGPAWVSWLWWPGYVGWCPYGYYNSWYWNCYGGYYPGYRPPHRPGYPGGGGGHPVPRRDVMPPARTASGRMAGDASSSRMVSGRAIDINGKVRMASVDRRGWTVVSQNDFASPNLSRLARSGDRVMPTTGDQMGVVMSGPLATRSPRDASPRTEIERVFRGVESRATADVSPLMARDSSLSADAARQLGRQTSFAELSRVPSDGVRSNRQTVTPRLTAGAGSPFATSSGPRTVQPNLYRPTMYSGSGRATSGTIGSSSSSAGSRQLVAPRTSSGTIGSSSPSGGSRQLVTPRSSPGTVGSGLSGGGSRQLVTPRSSSGRTGAQRPVIVPRSSSSGTTGGYSSSRSSAGVRAPSSRSSSSVRSSPSRSSAPQSRSVGGSRSSGGSSRSSGGSSRGSAGSSRSSGGSSSSGSSSTKSSGGRKR
jgi:hypothetical protein